MADDNDELLPHTRIDYALDILWYYKWQDNYDMMAARLIRENCPGDILDWGEPVVDAKTAKFNNISYITGCRSITCQECWEQEAYKEASNDAR